MAPGSSIGRLARSTAFRLALIYVALFVAAAAATGLGLIWQTNALLSGEVLRGLASERDELLQAGDTRGLEQLAALVADRSRVAAGTLYHLADARGVKLAGNLSRHPPELTANHSGGLFSYASTTRGGERQRLAAGLAALTTSNGRLVLARDVEDQRALIEGLRRLFLWSFAGLALAGLIGGVMASRMMLQRIETINATSGRIMAGDLGQRVPLKGSGDELDELATNLNGMLERIEQLMAGMREVSDNIAHDLKTPLNRLRSRAEAALRDDRGGPAWREGLESTIEEADELIRTFNALLLIARLEAGSVSDSFATFDLAAAVRDVAELYEPVAEEAQLVLEVTAGDGPMVCANRELIGQAVANLIDNALKYGTLKHGARAGHAEPIHIRVAEMVGAVEVSVSDRGPGIRADDRPRVLRRFVRLEASRTRPGTGLGLSLVAAVARMHGGIVRLADNAPGLIATLVLPARLVVSKNAGSAAVTRSEMREQAHAGPGGE